MVKFPAVLTTLDKLAPVFVLPTSFYWKQATHTGTYIHIHSHTNPITPTHKGSLTSTRTHTSQRRPSWIRTQTHPEEPAWLQWRNKTSSESQRSRSINLIESINIFTFWMRTQRTPLWRTVALESQLVSISLFFRMRCTFSTLCSNS